MIKRRLLLGLVLALLSLTVVMFDFGSLPSTRAPFWSDVAIQGTNKRSISLIVHLRGETANNLALLAHAYAVKLMIERTHDNLSIQLIGQHQNAPKWKTAADNLQRCFPSLRAINFEGGRWDEEYQLVRRQQEAWLGNATNLLHVDRSCANQGLCWRSASDYLETLLQEQQSSAYRLDIQELPNANVSLPHLHSTDMPIFDILLDNVYEELREWLHYDPQCCRERPHKETVVHMRNFAGESPLLLQKGYQEVNAHGMAEDLLGHLTNGSQVTLVSRYKDNLGPYLSALQERGWKVRVLEGQSDMDDFCYLLSADELMGNKMSSFVSMAGLLGNATRVTLYVVNSTWTRRREGLLEHYPSERAEIAQRFQFPIYPDREDG